VGLAGLFCMWVGIFWLIACYKTLVIALQQLSVLPSKLEQSN